MELECDLSKINNEELLRKMWQQSEDSNRKKEIRSQLYKLRESRLRDLYQGEIMADNSVAGFGKNPLVSHGDALADQSFQSLKSKEIRDSLSPTEMKFQSMALNNPNTTGWNVQSSNEISPDGRGYRAETLATTDGVESINGGIAEFKGRNEQRSSAHHQGDDKNFVKKAMESTNSDLQEKVVIGDENSGRTEVRTSSSKSTSSSQVIQSSTNVEYDDGYPIQQHAQPQKYLIDSKRLNHQDLHQLQQQEQQRLLEEQRIYKQQFEQQQQRQQNLTQQERRTTEQVSTTRQNTEQKNISQNIETQEMHEQNKRYVDMDKASPEYQQHVQHLMQQPGEIISNTVEYPKPNVKMITTVKRLPDGTIVRNKRYETEELTPNTPSTRPTSTAPNQTQPRRDSQQQPKGKYQPDSRPHSRSNQDILDNNTSRYIQDTQTDDVETKFSSIKKSSNKFSTESTSETIQEFDEHHPQGRPSSRPKPKTNDFSTHGFPSVRDDKPTQEYATERPHTAHPTQSRPSRPTETVVPRNIDDTDNITERRINTKDGEVIIISSEKKHNFKTSTNSERIVETEHIIHDDQPYQQIPDKRTQDFTTHGFPSVREPGSQQPKFHPSEKQMQPLEQDFPLDKLPPGMRIIKGDDHDDVIVVSSQKSHTSKHSSNTERVIEHELIRDGQQGGYPHNTAPYNYTVTTPGEQIPQEEFTGSPRKPNSADYSTQGFPSVKSPSQVTPGDFPVGNSKRPNYDYSAQDYITPSRPAAGLPSSHNQHPKSPGQVYFTQGYPSVKSPTKETVTPAYPSNVDGRRTNGTAEKRSGTPTSKTQPRTPSPNKYKAPNTTVRETTERVIRKEKEVDSAHRAFAASLRSDSPIDHTRRDSSATDSHTRHTPRSSVSSTKTFRRDMREGSHDSAPSETSRISTTTVTRSTPPRVVSGRTVATKNVSSKTATGSNDKLTVTSARSTKSPSPGKTVTTTTTTTTRTMTSKDVPKATEKSPTKKQSSQPQSVQPAPSSRSSTPSYNSRKLPTSVMMADDYDDTDDDDEKLKTISPFSSPSTRSRTPQKISPTDNDKPQDDRKMPPRPDNSDERRTVNRETTFEKTKGVPTQPHKPNFEQPNVEWVIVDDVDVYDHDDEDDDSNAFEVVDAKLNFRKTTTKLITQEKQNPVVPQRKSKPLTTTSTTATTVTTKQFPTIPSKSQIKPNDKSPMKTKPNDSRTPAQTRTQKPLTVSKSPQQAPSKYPTKVGDAKTFPKAPKPMVPSYASPLRKAMPKTPTEETTVRKTLKTSQVLREKTSKLIEAEKPKQKPQSPERKTKPQIPPKRKTNGLEKDEIIVVTEITHNLPSRKPSQPGYEPAQPNDKENEPFQGEPIYKHPQYVNEDYEGSPDYIKPQGAHKKPREFSPGSEQPQDDDYEEIPSSRNPEDTLYEPQPHLPCSKKPVYISHETNHYTSGIQIPQATDNKPKNKSPTFRKPPSPGFQKLQSTFDEHSPQYGKPSVANDKPNQNFPVFTNPQETKNEPYLDIFLHKKPEEDYEDKPIIDKPSKQGPQKIVSEQTTITETSHKAYPVREAPKRPDSEPKQKIPQDSEYEPILGTPGYRRCTEKPYQGSPDLKPSQGIKYPPKSFKVPEIEFLKIKPENKPGQPTSTSGIKYETYEEPTEGKLPNYHRKKPIESDEETQTFKPEADDDDDDDCVTESESIILTSKKTVAKHIQKFETNFLNKKSPKPQKDTTYLTKQPGEVQKKLPKIPVNKTAGFKSPELSVSPSRDQKKPQESVGKRPQSPTKHISPNRLQKNPTEPLDKRPKSPSKQTNRRPNMEMPLDDEYFAISSKTTKVVKEKIIKDDDDEEYPEHKPKGYKPKSGKPLETDDDEILTDNCEFVSSSTHKLVVSEKQKTKSEEPLHPDKKSPKQKPEPIQNKTDQNKQVEFPKRRAQSPNKNVSPTRTPKKSDQKLTVDDQTFRKTLRTTTDKVVRKVGEKEYPEEEYPSEKAEKPETKPKGREPYSQQTSDTEDEEIITETSEFVVKSTLKQVVADQEILEFKEPERDSKSPRKDASPTRSQKKPIEKLPEDKLKQPTGKRPQSPNKHVSPTRAQKKSYNEISLEDDKTSFVTKKIVKEQISQEVNDQKTSKLDNKSPTREIAEKRPLSPTKALSNTRNQMRQYPDKTTSFKEGVKPEVTPKNRKPYYETPSDNEEYETSTKTMENFTSSKTCKISDKPVQEPQSPNQQLPERKLTQEPGAKHPADKRPQSPTKSQIKPPHGDETYKMSLKTTKTVTQNTTKNEQHEHYPDERTPYIKNDKPETTPNHRKPYSDKPYSNNLKDKTLTCRMETEKIIQTFEEPQSPTRGLSPSRAPTQKVPQETGKRPQSPARSPTKPDQINPEDHETFPKTKNVSKRVENFEFCKPEEPSNKTRDGKPGLSEPIAKRPKSPQKEVTLARTQQYDEDDQTFRKTLKTIQTVTENITETPKPSPYEKKPQESKSNSFKPSETDGDDESFVETTEFVVKSTNKPKYPEAQEPTDDNETFVHTSEFIRNTTQKLITTEQTLETENDLYYADNTTLPNKETSPSTRSTSPKGKKTSKFSFVPTNTSKSPEDRKPSPTRGTSPKFNKKGPKSVTEDEETFKKSLRKIDIVIDSSAKLGKEKNKPKGKETDILKPSDTDEEEITTENEELVIETCEKNYIVERNYISEEEQGKRSSILVEPNEKQPLNKPFTSTYVETIEGQTYPEDVEQLPLKAKYPKDKHPSDITQEPWLPKSVSKYRNNVNEQFIETERLHKETPDGAFISKTHHPSPPTSPTFKKKGAGRSDTFEERCRQILGMDTYGDTPGAYKKQPSIDDQEIEEKRIIVTKEVKMMPEKTTVFQVKIEDCDEDDEPLSVNSVKKTLHKQIYTTDEKHKEPLKEEPKDVNVVKEQADKPQKVTIKPKSKGTKEIFEPEEDYIRNKTKLPESGKNELKQTITQTKTINKKTSQNKSVAETEPDSSSELENVEEKFIKEVKIIKKPSPTSSPRSSSPTKSTLSTPRSLSPTKETSMIKNTRPSKETPKEKPNKDSLEPKSNKESPQKRDDDTTTIKDRLRSSTRKTKSPAKLDQVDGSESSPEHSPTRYTERRRSSNISVTTEIIIEHTDSDSPNKKEKTPPIIVAKSHEGSVYKEIIDSTVLPEKLTRRLPVTERKESAPVHRVTSKDKDTKMSRSTSENLIKVKKPEPHSLSPKTPTKTTDHRRPNKCFATKSINLSATDRFVNVEDVANVVIDIQHAKSSREPSPDKIVPTPVPAHLDTGKPRYPDVVQEPEDDQPKRKPQVKNIPIFEEENNSYVGCHITEVNVERSHTTTYDSLDYEQQISKNPVVEAPSSLDYTSLDNPSDDESFLTVHEKVNKFQSINTDVKKPKAKEPYQPLTEGASFRTPQNDEYLVTITEKTEKKKQVKELVESEDEEFARNEHNYTHTTKKLAPTAPQKSPELVRTISKHISRQNEPDLNKEANEDYPLISHNDDFVECSVNNKNLTKEFKVSHHQKTTEVTANTAEKYQQPPKEYDDHDDDDELIPHTAAHTTILEERRQKDILSRPSVFDSKNKNKNPTATTKAPLKCNKSPVKDSEKLRSDIKSRTKPTSAVTNTLAEQNTATAIATTTVTALSNKPKQHSPQRKSSDIDYELRGCNVETGGVKNIISKQTKVYNTSNTSSDSKANDLNKNITTSNKKPEKHMPVRLTPATNSDDDDLSADDEMIISVEERTDIDIESQVVNENLNKKPNRQIPLTTCTTTTSPSSSSSHKKQPTVIHSSTNSSPTDQPLKATKTKEHVDKLTDKNPLKSNTVTSTSIKTYETVARTDDIDETVLEPATKKSPSHHPHTKNTKMSTTTTTTDSVAARRSLFESNNDSSSSATPTKRTPLTSPMSGRRPSYMDHTKSSLEHTRRDSLEINKTNYLRKPSQPEEELAGNDRSSTVKFDVPLGKRASTPRAISVTEDINVEEMFDLEVLEKLLETVQSYEIRRRIRAQIRLIKKNQKNELISSTTEITTRTVKTSKVGSEEPDNITINNRKPRPEDKTTSHITQTKEAANHISSNNKKEYIFEEAYHPTTRRSPKPNRYPYEEEEEKVQAKKLTRSQSPHSPVGRKTKTIEHQRDHSPDQHHHTEMVQQHSSRTTKQQHYYRDDHEHEDVYEIRHETSPTRKSPSPCRSSHSLSTSPERRYASPEAHKPLKANERNRSPQMKAPQTSRVTSSHSPDTKTTATSVRKSSTNYEQQETVKNSTTNKPQTKRMTTTTTTTTTKSKPEDKTPVWADRKNILKAPSSTTPKKPASSSTLDSRSGYTKTIKSTTSQKMTSNKSAFGDEDCITSSYGIGPTDENGLPLFGIRALKKKKSAVEPSETTEEVTGYVVEEKYYSDNKTKPKVERKEFIYSTNPKELQKLKEQVGVTTNRKALKDVDLKESRQAALISKATPALRSSPEDDFLDSASKYVRRGSVKEMSEKFIQKEASSTVTEKSNNYPKAGLILRTNSRKSSRDMMDNENENFESFKTTRVQQHHTSTVLADSDDAEQEYEVEEYARRHSGRFITESESECDSIKTQREFKKVTSSSSSSSMATRSFLNSQGEEKVVTNVSDCLERMRNADNVVEEGDTTEDQEARALLNKFLGASIIMKGVESSLPAATNRQSKTITTTTTSSNLSDDNDDGDNNAKHEVKTTRITKTIKSGSSSTPVTYTTCDIEEIWDEEILKELLEQARTYEERRKIRSRLRELMADREETKKSPQGEEKEVTAAAVEANVPDEEVEESSASEYEEIIEEVTDYSEAESEVDDKKQIGEKSQDKDKTSEALVTKTEEKSVTVVSSAKQEAQTEKQVEEAKTVIETATVEEIVEQTSETNSEDKTDSSEKGESLKPMVHNSPQNMLTTMPQDTVMHSNQSTNSQKPKSAQTSSNNNSKANVKENSSMHASHNSSNNNNNNKTQKVNSTAPNVNQNPIVTVQTAGRADSTSISHKNIRNNSSARQTNSNTHINNNNDSSSGSLGGNPVVVGSSDSSPRQVDRLGVPQKEDSGTESGEDLRLIAAGLRDQLQIQSDSNIIEDVTCALSRLENSLKEGKDISVDTEKRKALLALVARLRAGLTSPEKLAEIAAAMSELDGNVVAYSETSSPEADAHRSNRNRFGKRKNRVNRHTVGVSREELADARRYMEDMLLMSNISASTTPEANSIANNAPPQWYPLDKNASTSAILTQSLTPVLQRPKEFVTEENSNTTYTNRLTLNNGKRRPLSGEYSVSFENPSETEEHDKSKGVKHGSAPEDNSKGSRFTSKKHLMKRANTIDLAKSHKYNPECDTDSDAEDKGKKLGLKRTVQVSVKKRVQNAVPPFEPKTENDRKFLAFINKQSDRPGLGWTTSRSVSNWTNKFGSIKSTFEGGLVGKPPLAPHHVSSNLKFNQPSKLLTQPVAINSGSQQAPSYITNQQIASRLQREAERQAEERRKKMEIEHLEYERRERDKLERQRQQRERQERERLEREHFERQRREQDERTAAQHAIILREQEQLAAAQQAAANMNAPQPIPINEFKHAPQSVFRPIDSGDHPLKPIYKPIAQHPRNASNWQSFNAVPTPPSQYGNTRPDNSFITSPPPSSRSPIVLPWASKPTVDSSSFKSKAHRFEERSKYDNINATPVIQRHNSLRSANDTNNPILDDFSKRPSLPNAFDPYNVRQIHSQQDPLAFLPPPQNISFTYSSLKPKTTYQSYPCLPSAVVNNSYENEYQRLREDSLTNPQSVPLVLTSSNPLYCPATQPLTQSQQHQLIQPRLPRQLDLISPANSTPSSPSIFSKPQNDYTDDDLDSENNLLEYHAVSRVMRKPQGQTAVTVGRRTGHVSDDELYGKNSRAAKNLLSTMKSLGNSNDIRRPKAAAIKRPEAITSPKTCLSPDGRSYQAPIVEPLFPDINKFEANRQPLYCDDENKNHTPAPNFPQQVPGNQFGMYKSMENLSKSKAKSQAEFTQQSPPKPYVSETQTSYVVTYPIEDTTDDEDYSRLGLKKMTPPNTLDIIRHRNVSENSTGSSTTASMSFGQNLPSPNTSWTRNPIVLDESRSYQNSNKNVSTSSAESTYQANQQHQTTSYSNANQNYNPSPFGYTKVKPEYEAPNQRHMSSMPSTYNGSGSQVPTKQTQANSMPNYEAAPQKQFQQQQFLHQNTTNQRQMPMSQQAPPSNQKPAVIQNPTDYVKQYSTKTVTSTSTTQDKKSLNSVRKTEDHPSMREAEEAAINPKHSNISQEMLMRLDQQRERISKETRRKSLGNTLDYQMEKEARYETQNSQVYKSSAPSDTPDIVKSSLPKDETQPILKKFGPPQRHHYMPNSYQSPSTNTTSASVMSTSLYSNKNLNSSISKQTVVKTSQQIFNNTRPTVMETPATPQPDDDYIPRNIVYNNVHAFSSMNRRQEDDRSTTNLEQHQNIRPSKLSKSDSWNQIMMLQNQHVTSNTAKFSQSPTNELRRTKSGHTLALPKMFEAAMTKTDISEKQKTVAAYFTGQKSPIQQETMVEQLQQTTKRSVINRTKTNEKVSAAASRKSLGSNLPIMLGTLQRSATMPHIANINLLDESNVEDAFEQLIMEQKQQKSSSSTTEKTETKEKDGAVVTTTTKVTTRTVTGSAEKPASPFAKFKQLDKQNSQQSAKSPTTPTTPAGGTTASPSSGNQLIFKFTDPALNAKAATVKEQLLQWCQSKTQEYENIAITNFSTSWNNGLAFCALIHHFLPDAFDYSQLTPKNRRKNFELAFTVADEKAGIAPLLDVEDMVVMQRPDWKCVFVYVQSIYRRFRNCQ